MKQSLSIIYFKYFQKKVHHPYPLFQSDDPNVDDNIILLDNDQGTKETGVYKLNDYEDDYAEYDYKGGSYLFDMHINITLSVKYIVCIKKYIKVKLLQQTEYKYTKKRHICRDTR